MDQKKSLQKTDLQWQHFSLSFALTPDVKQEVLAIIKKKIEGVIKTLELSETELEAICSPYFSADVYVKQNGSRAIIPINLEVNKVMGLNTGNEEANQIRFLSAASAKAAGSDDANNSNETFTYRGAVKDPPPTPDPLLP